MDRGRMGVLVDTTQLCSWCMWVEFFMCLWLRAEFPGLCCVVTGWRAEQSSMNTEQILCQIKGRRLRVCACVCVCARARVCVFVEKNALYP